jgi:hypothetical protein
MRLSESLHDMYILQTTRPCNGGFPTVDHKVERKEELNVQMIAVEAHDEQPKIASSGYTWRNKNRADVTDQGNRIHQWVRKETEPQLLFDPRKEKETYTQARKEVIGA